MKQLKENHEKRRVYYYGFQIVIGAIVKGALLIATSLLLGSLIPTIFLLMIFGSFRMFAGGYHMDSYGKCILTSLIMFVILGTISQYTHQYWSLTFIAILIMISFISGMFVIKKWAPSDTPNRPITRPEEIRKFKLLSYVYCIVWMAVATTSVFLRILSIIPVGYNKFIIAGIFGFLLELFTISPAGYKFYDLVSGKIGH
jgi:accessory gene regulator B